MATATVKERRITKHLKYEFTPEEDRKNSKELARQNRALVEAEQKKKTINDGLKAESAHITAEIGRLSRWVTDGYDFREVDCKIIFNDPRDGIKSVYRVDTGELVEELAMETHEMQDSLPLEDDGEDEDDENSDDREEDTSGKNRPW